jgi:hypothetical protein
LATKHSRTSASKVSSYQDLEEDRPDLTVAPDEGSGGGSRTAFQDRTGDQELPASVTWTSGVVVGRTERRDNRKSERFGLCGWDRFSCGFYSSPHQMRTLVKLERG